MFLHSEYVYLTTIQNNNKKCIIPSQDGSASKHGTQNLTQPHQNHH